MMFALRIDLESQKGIKEGLPKILKLLKKYDIKASFYLTMGGESNIIQLFRYRKKLSCERGIKIFSKIEIIRMVLFPKNFVRKNKKMLQEIINQGHELGIHGWKHRTWTRGLEKINISRELSKSIKEYRKLFGKEPKSFCAPAFRINKKVIYELNKKDFEVISDLDGEKPMKIPHTNIINVPITIKGENNTPIIEYLVTKGKSDKEILEYLKKEIKNKEYSTMYIHGMYESREKIELLEKLFIWIKDNKIITKTILDMTK